jgi:LacI family sucrose operon transcriptional repressor
LATIKDIAEMVGVTVTTVSRVLNNRGYISEVTRRKVYQAMEDLQYQPNEIARSLSRSKSNLIGLIIPTIDYPFYAELANHLEYYAASQGYKILLCNSRMDQEKEKQFIDMLKSNQVDGIVMGSHTLNVEDYVNAKYPIVTFDRCIAEGIPYVASDNYQGGVLATELLINKGCKKIAHISGDLNLNLLGNLRSQAFLNTMKKQKIAPILLEIEYDVFENVKYEKRIHELFQLYPDIEGIFVCNDMVAVSLLKVCHQLGKRIPEDVKIVGYDDIRYASICIPQLTTIKQPLEEMCKLALDLIIQQINGDPIKTENVFPISLIEREST